jgi:DNA polymerase-3 subunit epsilon
VRALGRRAARGEGARAYLASRPPAARTPWRQAGYCVVDVELSRLERRGGAIISFGALPIDDGRVRLEGAAVGLVRPTAPLAESAIRVHGLRAIDLALAPPAREGLDPLLAAMAGRVLVAHHAPVERAFLGDALRALRLRLRGPVLDTAVLARVWLAERDGELPGFLDLGGLARECGLPVHSPHTAIGDALTTAQLFVVVASQLGARAPETVGSLARGPARLADLEAYWPRRGDGRGGGRGGAGE